MSRFNISIPMGEDVDFVTLSETYIDEDGEEKEGQVMLPASALQFICRYQTLEDGETHTEVITMDDIAEYGKELKRQMELEEHENGN